MKYTAFERVVWGMKPLIDNLVCLLITKLGKNNIIKHFSHSCTRRNIFHGMCICPDALITVETDSAHWSNILFQILSFGCKVDFKHLRPSIKLKRWITNDMRLYFICISVPNWASLYCTSYLFEISKFRTQISSPIFSTLFPRT